MVKPSDSANSMPADEPRANWQWLSERLDRSSTSVLGDWLDYQLEELESRFSHYVTPKSLARSQRAFREDRDR